MPQPILFFWVRYVWINMSVHTHTHTYTHTHTHTHTHTVVHFSNLHTSTWTLELCVVMSWVLLIYTLTHHTEVELLRSSLFWNLCWNFSGSVEKLSGTLEGHKYNNRYLNDGWHCSTVRYWMVIQDNEYKTILPVWGYQVEKLMACSWYKGVEFWWRQHFHVMMIMSGICLKGKVFHGLNKL